MKVAFLFEHPSWSKPLIDEIRRRGVEVEAIDVAEYRRRPDAPPPPVDRWINRVNTMPSAGRSASVVTATLELLDWLDVHDQDVVNPAAVHRLGASKAAQVALFDSVDMGSPMSVEIERAGDAPAAAESIGFPVLVKPDLGGSGVSISRFDHPDELRAALETGDVDLGIGGRGLVQQVVNSEDGMVYRVEMLACDVLYTTAQPLTVGSFNYCAIDGGSGADGPVELIDLDSEVAARIGDFMAAAGADVGSVEFMMDATIGCPVFFDFNPYSNYIDGYDDDLGFSPIHRYVDHVLGGG